MPSQNQYDTLNGNAIINFFAKVKLKYLTNKAINPTNISQ